MTAYTGTSLNSCKGVIRCKELIDCDQQEILSELKSQAVSDITNITIKDSSGGRKNTSTFIVTFKQTTIPQHIKIGYIRVPVAAFERRYETSEMLKCKVNFYEMTWPHGDS